jgi:ubiquitin carboxyl-terminal hydrolase 7
VYESFDKYCEVEELVGENRYRTDSHGLQDAVKGLKFEVLPPVLQLHLRRFDYDYQRDTMLKVAAAGGEGRRRL